MRIRLKNIIKSYGEKELEREVLKNLDFELEKGEMIAIMGSSGSGKSTLLNIISGITSINGGEYYFDDEYIDFSKRKRLLRLRQEDVSIIVQYYALIDDKNVYENIALPLKYRGCKRFEIRGKVEKVITSLGLKGKEMLYPDELSGGEKQRVAIARAIVAETKIILADEPTGALDEENTNKVLKIFRDLHENGKTIIIVTHDKNVAQLCNKIYYLRNGKLFDTDVV